LPQLVLIASGFSPCVGLDMATGATGSSEQCISSSRRGRMMARSRAWSNPTARPVQPRLLRAWLVHRADGGSLLLSSSPPLCQSRRSCRQAHWLRRCLTSAAPASSSLCGRVRYALVFECPRSFTEQAWSASCTDDGRIQAGRSSSAELEQRLDRAPGDWLCLVASSTPVPLSIRRHPRGRGAFRDRHASDGWDVRLGRRDRATVERTRHSGRRDNPTNLPGKTAYPCAPPMRSGAC